MKKMSKSLVSVIIKSQKISNDKYRNYMLTLYNIYNQAYFLLYTFAYFYFRNYILMYIVNNYKLLI